MPCGCVLPPAPPKSSLTRGAPNVHLARLFVQDQIDPANGAEASSPLAMSLFVLEQIAKLRIREAELKIVFEWKKPAAGLSDLKNSLVGGLLNPRTGSGSPVND